MVEYKASKTYVALLLFFGILGASALVGAFLLTPSLAAGSFFGILALILGIYLATNSVVTMNDEYIKIKTDPVSPGLVLPYKNIVSIETKSKNKIIMCTLSTIDKPAILSLAYLTADDREDVIKRLRTKIEAK